jgi:hypothetical protein
MHANPSWAEFLSSRTCVDYSIIRRIPLAIDTICK